MLRAVHEDFLRRLKDKYTSFVAKARRVVGDAESRADDYQDDVNNFFDSVQIEYARTTGPKSRRIATKIGKRTAQMSKDRLNGQLHSVLGVNVIGAEPWLESYADAFTRDNVDLIKSVQKQYFDQVETLVKKAAQKGKRWESLADTIQERYGVSESRARLIARDQVSKYNGDLERVRQQRVGIKTYIWRTSKDERVRDTHKALEGKSFSWDKPPDVGHPGEDYQCRCTAEPDIDGWLDSL